MLTEEQNRILTEVGPNTPMGKLYRKYWMPIAAASEMDKVSTKKVKVLGESLVLFKDQKGKLGLIEERCPHRGASLFFGIPENNGLRCAYHGWCYNEKGDCLEQPAEAPESTYKDRIHLNAYSVEELGGLIFAYLGPEPAPLLPKFDLFVQGNTYRTIGFTHLPVNWLQCMENSFDATHLEWLHGRYSNYVNGQKNGESVFSKKHIKIGFDFFEYGIIKRRMLEGQTEESDDWRVGHPVLFPHILKIGIKNLHSQFQIRVPMDDHNTMVFWYTGYHATDVIVPEQSSIPFFDVPYRDEQGNMYVDSVEHQDMFVWVTQGVIADRTTEHIGSSDKGVILYRKVLRENIDKILNGEDPLGTVRDAETNKYIALPEEAESKYYSNVPRSTLLKQAVATYRWLPEETKLDIKNLFDLEEEV